MTDENKETAPPTAASIAQEELISLWDKFNKPINNCNLVVCEVENSAWGLPTSAVVADPNESEEEDESADSFTWADFDTSGN